ncbi:MAG: hypothetical protein HKN12_09620, partial [Gemmatimonadetes bacterium]|nr:hypothetical protein [Gemmatimonadota bacterium]
MSRWLRGPALKLAVSLILVTFLVRRYGGDERFLETLRGLDPWAFVQAELLLAAGLFLSAVRWKILL